MTIKEYLEKKKKTPRQFARESGISERTIKRFLNGEIKNVKAKIKDRLATFGIYEGGDFSYVFYKGEETMAVGTLKECAEILKKSESCLNYYTTPSHRGKPHKGNHFWGIREEILPKDVADEGDETWAVKTILYVKNKKKGSVYLSNYNQMEKVKEWLESRGYIYECLKADQNDYEVKFAKVG